MTPGYNDSSALLFWGFGALVLGGDSGAWPASGYGKILDAPHSVICVPGLGGCSELCGFPRSALRPPHWVIGVGSRLVLRAFGFCLANSPRSQSSHCSVQSVKRVLSVQQP